MYGVYGHALHEYPPPLLYTWYNIYIHIYIGWVGVGRRRCCQTRPSQRELDSQGTFFFLFGGPRPVVELGHFCAGRTFPLLKGDVRIT